MLVEDNVMNQQMATFSVAKCGAELTVANHGGEAVDAVAALFEAGEANFDCVLMDMMMRDGRRQGDARDSSDGASRRARAARHRRAQRQHGARVHRRGESRGDEREHVETLLPGDAQGDAREREAGNVQRVLKKNNFF